MMCGKILAGVLAMVVCVGVCGAASDTPTVHGQYIEARTCAVWTGSCFANGEMQLIGKNAVCAWIVSKGSWNGVALDGLKVAAALNAEGTLHTKYEGKVTSWLFVDEKASEAQAKALAAMAKALAPDHLANVLKVERKAIAFKRDGIEAELAIGADVKVKTGPICDCYASGCTAYRFYPPVSGAVEVECAKAVEHSFQGKDYGVRWDDAGRQSAMLGTFAK